MYLEEEEEYEVEYEEEYDEDYDNGRKLNRHHGHENRTKYPKSYYSTRAPSSDYEYYPKTPKSSKSDYEHHPKTKSSKTDHGYGPKSSKVAKTGKISKKTKVCIDSPGKYHKSIRVAFLKHVMYDDD